MFKKNNPTTTTATFNEGLKKGKKAEINIARSFGATAIEGKSPYDFESNAIKVEVKLCNRAADTGNFSFEIESNGGPGDIFKSADAGAELLIIASSNEQNAFLFDLLYLCDWLECHYKDFRVYEHEPQSSGNATWINKTVLIPRRDIFQSGALLDVVACDSKGNIHSEDIKNLNSRFKRMNYPTLGGE